MTKPPASGPQFVHLHNHSEYSLMDGTIRLSDHDGKEPSEALTHLAQSGAKAVALTDHGNLYGAIEFYTRCRKVGLKPIIGVDFFVAPRTDMVNLLCSRACCLST